MTAENLAKHRANPNMPSGKTSKKVSNHFRCDEAAATGRRLWEALMCSTRTLRAEVRAHQPNLCPAFTVDPALTAAIAKSTGMTRPGLPRSSSRGAPAVSSVLHGWCHASMCSSQQLKELGPDGLKRRTIQSQRADQQPPGCRPVRSEILSIDATGRRCRPGGPHCRTAVGPRIWPSSGQRLF